MKKWTDIVMERVLNLFVDRHDEEREQYGEIVMDILQKSYKKEGGIHGNGFRDVEDMKKNIPFWKLVRKNGEIVTVVMYKGKDGRKMVAAGTNGSEEGKEALATILMQDLDPPDRNRFDKGSRSFFEVSARALLFLTRQAGYDFLIQFAVPISDVKIIMKDDEILMPEPNDPEYKEHPLLKKFFYARQIGDKIHTKIMFGVAGNALT